MHRRSVAVFDRFLSALAVILDKAEAHCEARKIKPEVILAARLFPDMFPFTRQVQLACDFAARGTARLAGAEPKSCHVERASSIERNSPRRGITWSGLTICSIVPILVAAAGSRFQIRRPWFLSDRRHSTR